MIVGDIFEFMVSVYDQGIPNRERIVLYANETVNTGQYGLMVGILATGNTAFPIPDNLFWFGDAIINKGDWIFIYTGPGEAKLTEIPNSTNKMYSVHWGRSKTVLNHQDLVPILFRVDAVQIPNVQPKALPNKQS